MRSPGRSAKREVEAELPNEYARRFKLSVADFVKMISSTFAPKKCATVARAPS